MKKTALFIGTVMALPIVNAQETVFFNIVFETIIFIVIVGFMVLAGKKILDKMK